MLKKINFKYEQEVRVVCSGERNKKSDCISINPLELIDAIVLSPKYSDEDFNRNKRAIFDFGFDEKIISKSTIYDAITNPAVVLSDI